MTDFLNLPNVTTLRVNDQSDRYVVEARSTEPRLQGCRLFCPLRRNGKKVREVNDTPIHGKPVLDLGRLSDVFNAEFYIVRDGRRFDQPKGLSTLDPDFDLAA